MKRKKLPLVIKEMYEHINASYFLYKICEGCDKLLMYSHDICPNCNAYRFNTTKSKVIKELKKFLQEEQEFILNVTKD